MHTSARMGAPHLRYQRLESTPNLKASYRPPLDGTPSGRSLQRVKAGHTTKDFGKLSKEAERDQREKLSRELEESDKKPQLVLADDWENWAGHTAGVIFPRTRFKISWDMLLLVCILYACVTVPFRLGMAEAAKGEWLFLEACMTLFFLADVILNFNVAYSPDNVHYVIHRPTIAKQYLRGWFIIDFPSSLPVELLELYLNVDAVGGDDAGGGGGGGGGPFSSLRLLRALRLLRLLRLLKVLKMQRYLHLIEDATDINLQLLMLLKLIVGILYLMHILGCCWFYLHLCVWNDWSVPDRTRGHDDEEEGLFGWRARGEGLEPVTWLTTYDGGSGVDASVWVQYLYSIYWALTTLTTVGYGDIVPANHVERLYVLFCELVGALVFGFLLSTLGDVLSNVDQNANRVEERLTEVKEYLRWHRVPLATAQAVRKFYEFHFTRKPAVNDAQILAGLTPTLRREVTIHLLEKSVARIGLFTRHGATNAYVDLPFQLKVYPLLKPALREAKEPVFDKGDHGDDVYFLSRGNVTATGALGVTFFSLATPGALFGEHCLLERPSPVACVASVRCEFWCVGKADLARLALSLSAEGRDELAENILEEYYRHCVTRSVALRLFATGITRSLSSLETAAVRMQRGFFAQQLQRLTGDEAPSLPELMPTLYGHPPRRGTGATTTPRREIEMEGVRFSVRAGAPAPPGASNRAPTMADGSTLDLSPVTRRFRQRRAANGSAITAVHSPDASDASDGSQDGGDSRPDNALGLAPELDWTRLSSAEHAAAAAAGAADGGTEDDAGGGANGRLEREQLLEARIEARVVGAVEAAVEAATARITAQVQAKAAAEGELLAAAAAGFAEMAGGLKSELHEAAAALDAKLANAIEQLQAAAATGHAAPREKRSSLLSPRGLLGGKERRERSVEPAELKQKLPD